MDVYFIQILIYWPLYIFMQFMTRGRWRGGGTSICQGL